MNEYILPNHVIRKTSSTIRALASKKIDDIMGTAATPAAAPPLPEPEAPKAEPKKRGRKAGPKADTIETPAADDGGINNEDGPDDNGADE